MSWNGLSQRQRVLALLRQRGELGMTAVDFALPGVADGGPPVMRVAARIEELRNDGFAIVDGGRDGKVKRYILRARAERPPLKVVPDEQEEGKLFTLAPARPGPYGGEAA